MKRFAFAPLSAFAIAAGAAHAAEPGNVVGGGSATISGGGDMTIAYSVGGAGGGASALSQPGRLTRFAGGHGDGQLVEYLTPAAADTDREAWLVGGGDNAEVACDRRR